MTEKTSPSFDLQPEKRLQSGDRIWIVTNIERFTSSYLPHSTPQRWHQVGALDLNDFSWRFFTFGLDDARAMLKAGIAAPPWTSPAPFGIEVKRMAHGSACEGRYRVSMTPVEIDPSFLPLVPRARQRFAREGFYPNATVGMWAKLEAAVALEKRVEEAVLSMVGNFSAGDLKEIVGEEVNVTRHLARMVDEGLLVPSGKTRGTRYQVAPGTGRGDRRLLAIGASRASAQASERQRDAPYVSR